MSKEPSDIKKDITNLKTELKAINNKLDLILEMLNSFTLMVLEEEELEDEEDEEDPYNTEWVPEQDEDWNVDEDDE